MYKLRKKERKIMTIKIEKLENELAKVKGILKANSLKLSKNVVALSASEKQDLWSKLEKLEDEMNCLLLDEGFEINSWDW
jgi:hypothetical protein